MRQSTLTVPLLVGLLLGSLAFTGCNREATEPVDTPELAERKPTPGFDPVSSGADPAKAPSPDAAKAKPVPKQKPRPRKLPHPNRNPHRRRTPESPTTTSPSRLI